MRLFDAAMTSDGTFGNGKTQTNAAGNTIASVSQELPEAGVDGVEVIVLRGKNQFAYAAFATISRHGRRHKAAPAIPHGRPETRVGSIGCPR
jgi:hypothetical protein